MRISAPWLVSVCALSVAACATSVVGDSAEPNSTPPTTKSDDAGYTPPWQPTDAGQAGDTGASGNDGNPDDAGDDGQGSTGEDAAAGVDAGVDSGIGPVDAAGAGHDSGGTGIVCGGYALPGTTASCSACSGSGCQANGCFGGYWCDTNTGHCAQPVAGCDAGL
jgi:hypothetical protein